jgi:signal peptidase complex subunit 3
MSKCLSPVSNPPLKTSKLTLRRVRGRPHYYSSKKEEYAVIKFSLSADLSSLFTWNTKQIFVYVSASWPNSTSTELTNEAVIWDTIITNPSADHLQNIGPVAMKKLIRSAKGKSIDPSRYVHVMLEWKGRG